jgi:hypothetical protein
MDLQPAVAQLLVETLNRGVHPVVPDIGPDRNLGPRTLSEVPAHLRVSTDR